MTEREIDHGGVYVALWTGGASILAIVFGLRGLWQHFQGSRADSADPVVATLALLTVPWLVSLTARLLRKHDSNEPLLSTPLLLLFSFGSIASSLWYWADDIAPIRLIVAQMILGIGGLGLWWRRVGTSRTQHRV